MSRYTELKEKFNAYWQKSLSTNEDLFAKMSIEDLVGLKKAVSNVNNILTLQTTNAFIKMLRDDNRISSQHCADVLNEVDSTHANTNGFDVESNNPDSKFVAEVKCNIPVEESAFGAAQEDGIVKDIRALLESKKTSKVSKEEIGEYYKFMVLLDVERVQESAKRLISKLAKRKKNPIPNIELYEAGVQLRKDIAYLAFVNPEINE